MSYYDPLSHIIKIKSYYNTIYMQIQVIYHCIGTHVGWFGQISVRGCQ